MSLSLCEPKTLLRVPANAVRHKRQRISMRKRHFLYKLSMCMLSHSVVSSPLWPHGPWPSRLLYPWNFPGKNTGVGCHFLLCGIFPAQELNMCLLYWRVYPLPLCHLGSPQLSSVQFTHSVSPMDCSAPGLPVHHWLQEFTVSLEICKFYKLTSYTVRSSFLKY